MMQSFDVSLFEVGFLKIVEALTPYGVDLRWEEKERDKAMQAWKQWRQLSEAQYEGIAHALLVDVEPLLKESLEKTLDNSIPREVQKVEVTLETNLGESRRYIFPSLAEAIEFLKAFDDESMLNDENGPAIWDTATVEDDEP
jgi:hypothetical protein